MSFAANFSVTSFNGTNGTVLWGPIGHALGINLATGDFNGDGIDDVGFGSPWMTSSFVLFGGVDGLNANWANLDPADGLRFSSTFVDTPRGVALVDLNGDGQDQFVTGHVSFDDNGIVDIWDGPFSSYEAVGLINTDIGYSLANVGDVNGDGFEDLLVGARGANATAQNTSRAFLVFGQAADRSGGTITTWPNTIAIRETSAAILDFGRHVSGAGDLNGDGIDDLVIAIHQGDAFVVFGKTSGWTNNFDVLTLDGTNGLRLTGAAVTALTGGSDVNGDGLDDLIVGSRGLNQATVVFGRQGGFGATLDLTALDSEDGFHITGPAGQTVGHSTATGDIDGDGLDDVIVGTTNGGAYVVFGQRLGFSADVDLATLNGADGFHLAGDNTLLSSYLGFSVTAGDINADGIDDLIVGSPLATQDSNQSQSGALYVVYGQAVVKDFTGGAGDDLGYGGGAGDSLIGGLGKDRLYGLLGDDTLDGGDGNDSLFGDLGADDILGGVGADYLDGGDGDDQIAGGDGADKLFGGLGADALNGGAGADRFEGGLGVDTLTGGADNDYLDGGAGADIMIGGAGNDVYIVDNISDQTHEAVGEGYDVVRTTVNITLWDNIEAVELYGGAYLVYGNALGNSITSHVLVAGLYGFDGNDTIQGGAEGDGIVGGRGNDVLRGGGGGDSFVVWQESLGQAVIETDQILDFNIYADRIDLTSIDAVLGGADDAFTYVGASFTRNPGEMTLQFTGGLTVLRLDQNGDGKADYQMKINGDVTGATGGWWL